MTDENYVVQRWRKPPTVMAVADDMSRVDYVTGRPTASIRMRYHPDDVERLKLGYLCFCGEPQETPFPDKCGVCGYPMRERQREDFEHAYGGVERDKRAVNIEQGLDRVDDTHERRFHQTKSGIIVPRPV